MIRHIHGHSNLQLARSVILRPVNLNHGQAKNLFVMYKAATFKLNQVLALINLDLEDILYIHMLIVII